MDDALESLGTSEGMGSDPLASSEPMDDFGAAISEAFPENDWTPERLDAMKEAIRICMDKDAMGGYGGATSNGSNGGGGKGGAGLALIFGPSKKKS